MLSVSKTVRLGDLAYDPVILAMPGQEARLTQIDDLKASIPVHGLLQSLKVRVDAEGVRYLVTAGSRRLSALQWLRNNGGAIRGALVTDELQVPVIHSEESDDDAREQAVAENIQRVPPTPVAEARAFGEMAKSVSEKDIAAHFGVPVRRVQQRLKLAALHPDVLAALEAGKISLEGAQAFTVEPDPNRQAAYLKKARGSWDLEPGRIKQAFVQQLITGESPIAKLIGKKKYVAAGGEILGDAFDDKAAWWISQEIIDQLIEEHWVEQKPAWLEEGWLFVETSEEFGMDQYGNPKVLAYSTKKLEPVPLDLPKDAAAKLAKIEAEIRALEEKHPECRDDFEEPDDPEWEMPEGADAAQNQIWKLQQEINAIVAKAPKAFSAEQCGMSGVVYWPDGSRPAMLGVVRPGTKLPGEASGSGPAKPAATLDDPGPSVTTDLNVAMTMALQKAVVVAPETALQLLVATLHAKLGHSGYPNVNVDVRPVKALEGARMTFIEALAWAKDQDATTLQAELARQVASVVDVRGFNSMRGEEQTALVDFINPDALSEFDPEAYFKGITKPLVVLAYREMTGEPLSDRKKADMAAVAVEAALRTGWLPPQLRTPSYAGPPINHDSAAGAELRVAAE